MGTSTAARADWIALGAALITVALWGTAFVGIRAAAADLSPGSLAFGRLAVGSLLLGTFVLIRRPSMPRGRDLALVVAAGVLWFGAYNVSLNAAEQIVDAGTAAMLVSVGPILIVILAGAFLGEGFPRRLLVGSIIAFGGAVVIGLATTSGTLQGDGAVGIGLCLVAALAYAIGVTVEKPVLARIPALSVTFIACVVGTLVTAPFGPTLADELPSASAASVAWLVFLGAGPTALAFTTWAYALGRTSAGRLGSTSYLVAPIAVLLGWGILGEVPPLLAILGGAGSILGVMIARSRG